MNKRVFFLLETPAHHFADVVFIGYFFLCILQIISIIGGDKSEVLVMNINESSYKSNKKKCFKEFDENS